MPCPPGQTRNAKNKVCRDKKKPGAKATRKNTTSSSSKPELMKARKLYGSTLQYLSVKFAEDRIKDKKPVIGIDAQGWEDGDKLNMKVFHFIGFGKDTMMDHKDLSSKLTDEKQTLHYISGTGELWASPANNSANAKTDNLCSGSGCDPIFVMKC
jgi:hypothetical protein